MNADGFGITVTQKTLLIWCWEFVMDTFILVRLILGANYKVIFLGSDCQV